MTKKTGTAAATIFVYDVMGQLVAEYGGVQETGGTQYLHTDHLGSTRLITDGTNATRRFDYFPFGGELTGGDTTYRSASTLTASGVTPAQRFTGKERDGETGLDYFGARYMSAAQGRFTSPDPMIIMDQKFVDPQ
ncbi:RHS repeat-associated core domain-containing protein [Bryobacter aggregatus]|uniref:RHS repeat-associated core domain-containing protein n=1 Tax=Bryobacter aggregatus TaxID=360054 RepID=UPI00138E399A|nr:RHS repeat-associated core domain-containing protein [Bryobacter aggregatus]